MSGFPPTQQSYRPSRSEDTEHRILVTLQAILGAVLAIWITLLVWLLRIIDRGGW